MTYGSFCFYRLLVCSDLFIDIWMIFVTLLSRVLFGEKMRLNRPYFVLILILRIESSKFFNV